jgi:type I restriction enzyme S subunit
VRRVRLKQVADVQYGLGQPPPSAPDGVPILRATNIERGRINPDGLIFAHLADLPLGRAPLLKAGEILVVRSGAYTGDSALVPEKWAGAAPGYDLRVTPRSIEPRFLAYQLLAAPVLDQIALARTRAAQPHLNAEDLGDVVVDSGSRLLEAAIADHLDAETARIDAMVQLLQRQADLFSLRLSASVNAILDSLQPWLPLRRVIAPERDSLIAGPFGSQMAGDDLQDAGVAAIVDQGVVIGGEFDSPKYYVGGDKWVELRRFEVRPGDLLVSGRGTIGRVAIAPDSLGPAVIHPSVLRVRADPAKVETLFLAACLKWSTRISEHLRLENTATTIGVIYSDTLRGTPVPVPPLSVQREACARIAATEQSGKQLVAAVTREVELLLERRQALITAAVTGQIEIPGVAA